MGNIRIEPIRVRLKILEIVAASKTGAALVAIIATEVILVAATTATTGQLSAWHGNEGCRGPFDYLQIAYHERMIEGYRAKSP